jgi:hypothetical protein
MQTEEMNERICKQKTEELQSAEIEMGKPQAQY